MPKTQLIAKSNSLEHLTAFIQMHYYPLSITIEGKHIKTSKGEVVKDSIIKKIKDTYQWRKIITIIE